MKKLLTSLLALVLVFSLVACSTNTTETTEETTTETTEETTTETTEETTEETEEETEEETTAEATTTDVTLIALKGNNVLASAEGAQQALTTAEIANFADLRQGHAFTYTAEGTPEFSQPLSVESASMLGKKIGTSLDTTLVDSVLSTIEGVKVVDTRTEEEFAAGHLANAINISAAEVAAMSEGEPAAYEEFLAPIIEQFTQEDVVVLLGSDPAQNGAVANVLYSKAGVPVTLNAGLVSDYSGELVTE